MSLDLNDPRLTAYALNELEPREREELEKLIANDPEAQALVNDLRDTAAFLATELGAEPSAELAPEQKDAIHAEEVAADKIVPLPVTQKSESSAPAYADKDKVIQFPFVKWIAWGCGIAASVALLAGLSLPAMSGAMSKAKQVQLSQRLLKESYTGTDHSSLSEVDTLNAVDVASNASKAAPVLALNAPTPEPAPVQKLWSGEKKTDGRMAYTYSGAPAETDAPISVSLADSKYAERQVPSAPALEIRNGEDSVKAASPTFYYSAAVSASAPASSSVAMGKTEGRADLRSMPMVTARNGSVAKVKILRELTPAPARPAEPGNESYAPITENEFLAVKDNPLSTFSIDVDTASYANMRRFLENGQRPPRDAVRIEELVNYFPYAYRTPEGDDPFAANVEIAGCPWNPEHRLARIGLKGREIARDERPASNLVFLIDVSGSMNDPNKLPLVKASLEMLVKKLNGRDRIAIAVYAGNSGLVLRSTPATPRNKASILSVLDRLEAGGSTNGGEGIQLAYAVARENFIKGGTNRVILCTDGDFNVGVTSSGALIDLIKEQAKSGVFLTICGFGTENLKDSTMMNLADKGNGNYAYIDSLQEGRKVFVEQMSGTLVTIAKDVKIQIEFNPARVGAYRLIGYEKRMLAKEDFNNDKKDAGEIGAGHTVTALYEIVPAGQSLKPAVDPLKYQSNPASASNVDEPRSVSSDLFTLKIRYKQPDGATSKKLEFPIRDDGAKLDSATADFKFAASVAAFGMILRDSEFRGDADYDLVLKLARAGKGEDEEGYRSEFIRLVKEASELNR